MSNLNMSYVEIAGRLTNDPITKTLGSSSVTNFSIAVNHRKDKVSFFNCSAFGRTGENVEKYFKKGDPIYVRGEIQIEKYSTKDGRTCTAPKITVTNFDFIDGKNDSSPDADLPF